MCPKIAGPNLFVFKVKIASTAPMLPATKIVKRLANVKLWKWKEPKTADEIITAQTYLILSKKFTNAVLIVADSLFRFNRFNLFLWFCTVLMTLCNKNPRKYNSSTKGHKRLAIPIATSINKMPS